MLPALLLLTDYWWNPGFSLRGIRRNWRLYGPIALGAAAGLAFIWELILTRGNNAGFGIKEFTWYEYFFTQGRALFVYLRLFIFPTGQTLDYDFPISRTMFEHGAIFGLVALAALTVAALLWRRRFPLASYGWMAFLILMAPTSSFVPITDPVAERRMYISFIGLILIAVEFLRRLRVDYRRLAAALAAVVVLYGIAAYRRNQSGRTASCSGRTPWPRPPTRPAPASSWPTRTTRRGAAGHRSPNMAARPGSTSPTTAAGGLGARARLPQSARPRPSRSSAPRPLKARPRTCYSLMGMVYAKRGRWQEALECAGGGGEDRSQLRHHVHLPRRRAHGAEATTPARRPTTAARSQLESGQRDRARRTRGRRNAAPQGSSECARCASASTPST